ncbi:MAG: cytochrome c [Betaproteobacteria bacterium]|nr:MAG: cytochrome c [Betaproteobacteria bacterium]TMG77886.1 MAG: cytochrome c [Betaproteobacteria bacterium]
MPASVGMSVVFGVLAAAPGASAQDRSLIEAGAQVYQTHCAECHGEKLVNTGSTFDLRRLRADERPRFDKATKDGKGQMPAWGGVLSAEEFDQLWAYVRSKADD